MLSFFSLHKKLPPACFLLKLFKPILGLVLTVFHCTIIRKNIVVYNPVNNHMYTILLIHLFQQVFSNNIGGNILFHTSCIFYSISL